MDRRVCPICKPFENQIFEAKEDKPKIPLHFNCRCTYDVIFKEAFDYTREPSEQFASVQEFEASFTEAAEAIIVSRIAKRNKITMLKLMQVIEAIENE